MVSGFILEKEKVGVTFFFSVPNCSCNKFGKSFNFKMMSFPETSTEQCTRILPVSSGKQINMLSKVSACSKITFLGQLADFILIIFIYQSTVSFETGNIKQFLGGTRFMSPFPLKSTVLIHFFYSFKI